MTKMGESVIGKDRQAAFVGLLTWIRELAETTPGAVLEVGVYKGGSALLLTKVFPDRIIYLADTFTGIPYRNEQYDHKRFHPVGYFNDTSEQEIRELFNPFPNVVIIPGIFPESCNGVLDEVSFVAVHLDCDMYQSYKDSLEYVYDKVIKGGIVILDDYNILSAPGTNYAVDEFIKEKSEKVRYFEGEYFIIKG